MRHRIAVLVVLALSVACSDGATGPASGSMSVAEASAVGSAVDTVLGNASTPGGVVGMVGVYALLLPGRAGALSLSPVFSSRVPAAMAAAPRGSFPRAVMGDYRVVGRMINVTRTHAGSPPAAFAVFALVAWNGFDPAANTVENALVVGTSSLTGYAASGSGMTGTLGGGSGLAMFLRRATNTAFSADTGVFTVSSWSSGATTGCGHGGGSVDAVHQRAVGGDERDDPVNRAVAAGRALPPGGRRAPLPLELGVVPVERGRAADDLHDVGMHLVGNAVHDRLGRLVDVLHELDLHQFMSTQHVVERLAHRIGDAMLPDVHEGLEVVSFGAQFGAFLRGDGHGGRA